MSASATISPTRRVPLKRLFKIVNGATPSSGVESYWNGDVPWVTPEDLGSLKSRTIVETRRLLTEDGLANCGASMVPAQSLILSTRAPIGHLAITAVDCCTNQGCKALVPRDGQLDSYFYYQLIAIREILQARGRGSTFKELSTEDLSQVELWCPPSPSRSQIAAYLDRETAQIDALVAEKETLLGLLEEKRASLISHAVTRGLNPKAKLKPSGIPWLGDVPVHWEVKELRHLVDPRRQVMYGIVLPGPHIEDGSPIIKGGDVKPHRLNPDTLSRTTHEIAAKHSRSAIRAGDILFSIRGSIGDVAIVPPSLDGANITQDAARIAPRDGIDRDWLFWSLQSKRAYCSLEVGSLGAAVRGINIRDLKRLWLALPPLKEQQAIGVYLTRQIQNMKDLESDIQTSINLLREKRSSLISAAVTGEMAVP